MTHNEVVIHPLVAGHINKSLLQRYCARLGKNAQAITTAFSTSGSDSDGCSRSVYNKLPSPPDSDTRKLESAVSRLISVQRVGTDRVPNMSTSSPASREWAKHHSQGYFLRVPTGRGLLNPLVLWVCAWHQKLMSTLPRLILFPWLVLHR
jgi:hypothetical protein